MASGIQIIGLLFGLIAGYFTFLNFKRGEFTLRECLGWETVWVAFILATVFPQSFKVFSSSLGAVRALDLFTVFGFIVVLSISFYTYINLDRLRRRVEQVVRDLALQEGLTKESYSSKKTKK